MASIRALALWVAQAWLFTSVPSWGQSDAIPPHIQAAVSDSRRPESDIRRDQSQKPGELLAFAGVKRGHRIADFWPLPPYSTRLLSSAVGSTGHVYAVMPEKVMLDVPEAEGDIAKWLSPYPNTTLLIQAFDRFESPEPLDVVYMGKIYHDFPNEAEMGPLDISAVNRAVFQALRPGGVFLIVEHAAAEGSGYLDTEPDMSRRLHRIDPQVVKQQVTAAGFVLEAESEALANPSDPRTKSVFDSSIRDRTDRFVMRFRKPL